MLDYDANEVILFITRGSVSVADAIRFLYSVQAYGASGGVYA